MRQEREQKRRPSQPQTDLATARAAGQTERVSAGTFSDPFGCSRGVRIGQWFVQLVLRLCTHKGSTQGSSHERRVSGQSGGVGGLWRRRAQRQGRAGGVWQLTGVIAAVRFDDRLDGDRFPFHHRACFQFLSAHGACCLAAVAAGAARGEAGGTAQSQCSRRMKETLRVDTASRVGSGMARCVAAASGEQGQRRTGEAGKFKCQPQHNLGRRTILDLPQGQEEIQYWGGTKRAYSSLGGTYAGTVVPCLAHMVAAKNEKNCIGKTSCYGVRN